MKRVTIVFLIVLIGLVLVAVAARPAPPSGEWICRAGGSCHVLIEWNEKQPTTLFVLNTPNDCNVTENGDVGFIIVCE